MHRGMIVFCLVSFCAFPFTSSSGMNTDQMMLDGGYCLIHAICDIGRELDVKHILDQILDVTLEIIIDNCRDIDLEGKDEFLVASKFREEQTWSEMKFACDAPQEIKDDFIRKAAGAFHKRMSEECIDTVNEECEGMARFLEVQSNLTSILTAEGECFIEGTWKEQMDQMPSPF